MVHGGCSFLDSLILVDQLETRDSERKEAKYGGAYVVFPPVLAPGLSIFLQKIPSSGRFSGLVYRKNSFFRTGT